MAKLEDFAQMRQGRRSKAVTDDSLVAAYSDLNPAYDKAVLMIHGFTSTPAVFRHLIKKYQQKNYAILCPKLAGHGESIEAFGHANYRQWQQSVSNSLAKLQQHYAHIEVIGLSLGGVLAYELSLDHEFAKTSLLAPAFALPFPTRPVRHLTKLVKGLGIKRLPSIAGNIHSGDDYEIAYRKIPLDSLLQLFDYMQSIEIKELQKSTTIYLGRHDRVISNKKVARLFANIPHTSIKWLNSAAHVLPLEPELLEHF